MPEAIRKAPTASRLVPYPIISHLPPIAFINQVILAVQLYSLLCVCDYGDAPYDYLITSAYVGGASPSPRSAPPLARWLLRLLLLLLLLLLLRGAPGLAAGRCAKAVTVPLCWPGNLAAGRLAAHGATV